MKKIPKIVLEGGPCGGKTQGLSYLNDKLSALGYTVFVIKESAEALIASGTDRTNVFEFQKAIALNQLKLEKEAEEKAEKTENPVIICDRGLIDAKVYLSDTDFYRLKKDLNICDTDINLRYDAVFHMDSVGKSSCFEDNGIRNETPDEAEQLNVISKKIWSKNSNFAVIPVCESFDEKLEILLKKVNKFLNNRNNKNL